MAPTKKMPAVAEQVQAELQDYLNVKGINALFVAIVEGLLIEKPTNPIAFIIEFLCKSYPDLAVQARIPELLQAQRADMDKQAAEARAAAGLDEDDEMEDDEEVRLVLNGGRRGGVSSGGLSTDNIPQGAPKSEEQKDRISDTIFQNGFLRQLDESVQDALINSVVARQAQAGDVIIAEGAAIEEANEFFIIEEGKIEMKQQRGETSRILGPGESFGELALLHGSKREATFTVSSPTCTLWVLGRDAYRATIMRATEARRTRYKDFLRQVSCLKGVSDYDILALADASEEVSFTSGEIAYEQGDDQHRLSVVLRGEASCYLKDAAGTEREVARLKPGDHFIEDADNPAETTNVRAVGAGKKSLVLLRVESDVFLRLAGSILTVAGTTNFDSISKALELTSTPTPNISSAQQASWQNDGNR
jgi:CRP-like cAMP-binding protein